MNTLAATDFENPPEGFDPHTDSAVVLDDGDTYSGVEGARVWLDGKGYLISELLDFYLALNEKPMNRDNEDRPVCPLPSSEGFPEDGPRETCPCGSDKHSADECPVDDWQ